MTRKHAKIKTSMLKTRNFYLILLGLQAPVLLGALFYILTSNPFILTSDAFAPALKSLVNIDKEVTAVSRTRVMAELSQNVLKAPVKRVPKRKLPVVAAVVKEAKKVIHIKTVELAEVSSPKHQAPAAELIKDASKHELASTAEFKQYGLKVETEALTTVSWSDYFAQGEVAAKLAELKVQEETRLAEANTPLESDEVTESQASATTTDPAEFNNDEEAIALNILLKEKSPVNESDELVLIDYSNSSELGDSTSNIETTEGTATTSESNVVTDQELLGEYANLFDGPAVGGQAKTQAVESPVSETVMNVIARNQNELLAEVDQSLLATQLTTQKMAATKPGKSTQPAYDFKGNEQQDDMNASSFVSDAGHRLVIQALVGKKGQELENKVYNYEFIPSFNPSLSLYDNAEGEIAINGNLHSETALLSGSIVKAGFVRTRVEIPVERGYIAQPIALLEQETLLSYFEAANLAGNGGHLLVQLNEQIDDVEIDAAHESKLFLNEKLEIVKTAIESTHILFVGIAPGNLTLTYGHGQQSTTKVIGVYEDELFVDTPLLKKQAPAQVKLVERNLMGKSATDLLIDGDKVRSFQSGKTSIPLAYNNYEIDHGIKPIGMRNYLEFNHHGPIVMGGHSEKALIEVPSRDYMENILSIFSLPDLSSSCLVQVNFTENVESVEMSAEGARGGIDYDSLYLDRDGVFNKDASELASKLFISGHEQGIFYMSVNYQNGSKDIFKTFCSLGTYLFEQL